MRSNKSQDVLMVYYWRTKDWNGLHQSLAADGSQRSSTSEISSTCCSVAKCFNINLHASWKANYLQEFHKARRTIGWELGPPQDEGVSNFRQDSGQVLLSIGTAAKQHCTSTQVIIAEYRIIFDVFTLPSAARMPNAYTSDSFVGKHLRRRSSGAK